MKKQTLIAFLYGDTIKESMDLDNLLISLKNGLPTERSLYFPQNEPHIDNEKKGRQFKQLLTDGFINQNMVHYTITSKGIIHLNNGGYVAQIRQNQKATTAYWLSIASIIIASLSALFGFLNRS